MENNSNNEITIVDIKIPFMSMVAFMIKAAIAAIPAFIIVSLIIATISVILSTIFGSAGMMMLQ